MFLGFLAMKEHMKPPAMDAAFDDKSSCTLTGRVDMTIRRPRGYAYYLKDNLVSLPDGNTYPVEKIIVYSKDEAKYLIGNKINVSGTICKFPENTNPGGFNEHLYYKIQNTDYKVYSENISLADSGYSKFRSMLSNIKERLINTYMQILPEKEARILTAMVLGEKYMLDDGIKSLYRDNGISHILAISGLHISMIGAAVYYILRKLKLGLYVSTVLSLGFVYSYGVLTNFSVSTNRAVVMYIIFLGANLAGKTFDLLSALSLSAFIILLQNPMSLFDAGFLLSFGAVFGIALIFPCFNRLHEAKNFLVSGLYASAGAQIFTLPVVLYYFFQIPLYSVIINMIVVPLTSLLVLTALAAGISGTLFSYAGVFLAGGARYILLFYEAVCRLGKNLPKSLITAGRPDKIRIILYFSLIFAFIISVYKTGKKRFLVIPAVAIGILIFPKAGDGLTVAVLDVGQGDAIYMETERGTTFLIDGGSMDVESVGTFRIRPFLLSRGVDRIDYAIVTHADTDHINGLIELVKDPVIKVSNLVLPKIDIDRGNRAFDKAGEVDPAGSDNYRNLLMLAQAYKVNIMYIKAGDYIKEGMLKILCLHPSEGFRYASENAYSAVLSIHYGDFDMLLCGDLEEEGEDLVVSKLKSSLQDEEILLSDGYEILKVAHHGSKYSTKEEFLNTVRPKISIISCGKNNRYGHPHKELIDRLNLAESRVFITYETGAVTIMTDGKTMKVKRYLKEN